jgi:hypothetical protein
MTAVLSKGIYEGFETILSLDKHAIHAYPDNPGHAHGFKLIILDYVKIGKGSCVDFFMAHRDIMTPENINELIHIAIEQGSTCLEDVRLFIKELVDKKIYTNSDIFLCSQNAFDRFSKVLSEHYKRIYLY